MESPPESKSYWQLIVAGRWRVSSLYVCSLWLIDHIAVKDHTRRKTWAAQIEVDGLM